MAWIRYCIVSVQGRLLLVRLQSAVGMVQLYSPQYNTNGGICQVNLIPDPQDCATPFRDHTRPYRGDWRGAFKGLGRLLSAAIVRLDRVVVHRSSEFASREHGSQCRRVQPEDMPKMKRMVAICPRDCKVGKK